MIPLLFAMAARAIFRHFVTQHLGCQAMTQTAAESLCEVIVRRKGCIPVAAHWFWHVTILQSSTLHIYSVTLCNLTTEVHQLLRCSLQAS